MASDTGELKPSSTDKEDLLADLLYMNIKSDGGGRIPVVELNILPCKRP